MHQLYESCCQKRFRPFKVHEEQPIPRTTLYKYLIIPKGEEISTQPQLDQPVTSNSETQRIDNPLAPRPFPRSSSKDHRSSETKPGVSSNTSAIEYGTRSFSDAHSSMLQDTEAHYQLLKRSQFRSEYDEE